MSIVFKLKFENDKTTDFLGWECWGWMYRDKNINYQKVDYLNFVALSHAAVLPRDLPPEEIPRGFVKSIMWYPCYESVGWVRGSNNTPYEADDNDGVMFNQKDYESLVKIFSNTPELPIEFKSEKLEDFLFNEYGAVEIEILDKNKVNLFAVLRIMKRILYVHCSDRLNATRRVLKAYEDKAIDWKMALLLLDQTLWLDCRSIFYDEDSIVLPYGNLDEERTIKLPDLVARVQQYHRNGEVLSFDNGKYINEGGCFVDQNQLRKLFPMPTYFNQWNTDESLDDITIDDYLTALLPKGY